MKQVVIVDDNRLVAEGIRAAIDWERMGASVSAVFYDGFGLLEYMQNHPVSLIITDINMPGINGLEMAQKVLKTAPHAKIIFISAYDDFDYARQAVQLGAFDYVEKPLDYGILSQIIEKAVRRIDQEQRNRELLHRSRPALITSFFTDLLEIPAEDSRYYLADTAAYLDIPAGYPRYLCLLLQIADDDVLRRKIGIEAFHMLMLELNDELETGFGQVPYHIMIQQRSEIVVILGTGQDPAPFLAQVNATLESIIGNFSKKGISVIAGVGRIQESLWNLKRSCDQAQQALRYRFYLPQKELFDIRDFSAKGGEDILYSKLKEDTLIRLLLKKDSTGLQNYFDLLAKEFEHMLPSQNSVALFCYEIAGKLLRFLFELDISTEAVQQEIRAFTGKFSEYATARELCGHLLQISLEICRVLEDSSQSYHQQLNKQINDYIGAHYEDNELCLGNVAASVNVSPTHLSALYKKMNGINLTEAISRVRMEAAQQLLRHSQASIKEISERVGFSNQYYFSACFKKHFGQTPSEFREKQA